MLTVMTCMWRQENSRFIFTAAHVNGWAKAVRDNTTIPIRLCCVTDIPDGIDPSIEILPLPTDFDHISVDKWSQDSGLPQCFKRLAFFHKDAGKIYGDRFCWMDLDILITGDLDPLFSRTEDFLILRGSKPSARMYSGGFVMMDAGCRPQVYDQANQAIADVACSNYVGSDQAVINHVLGQSEKTLCESDGFYRYNRKYKKEHGAELPGECRILFFSSFPKAFNNVPGVTGGDERDRIIIDSMRNPKPRFLALHDERGIWSDEAVKLGAKVVCKQEQVRKADRVFMHLDHSLGHKERTLGFAEAMQQLGIKTLPSYTDAQLYDNKVAQYQVLNECLPPGTVVITDKQSAETYAKAWFAECEPWLVSKSSNGAGNSGVRYIKNLDHALCEIDAAFVDGIEVKNGTQHGYVYFQPYIENDYTMRVVVTGEFVWGYTRKNSPRTGMPYQPSQGEPMRFTRQHEATAGSMAVKIAEQIGTRWCAFDFIADSDGNVYVLELSCSWPVRGLAVQCPLYTRELKPAIGDSSSVFRIAKAELMGDLPGYEQVEPEVIENYKLLRRSVRGKKGDIVGIEPGYVRRLQEMGVIGYEPVVDSISAE